MVQQLGYTQSSVSRPSPTNLLSRASLVDLETKLSENILTALNMDPETSPGRHVIKAVKAGIYEIPISPVKGAGSNRIPPRSALGNFEIPRLSGSNELTKIPKIESLNVRRLSSSKYEGVLRVASQGDFMGIGEARSFVASSKISNSQGSFDIPANTSRSALQENNINHGDCASSEELKQCEPTRKAITGGQHANKATTLCEIKITGANVIPEAHNSDEKLNLGVEYREGENERCKDTTKDKNTPLPNTKKTRARKVKAKLLAESDITGLPQGVDPNDRRARLRRVAPVNYKLPSLGTKLRRK